MSLQFIDLPKEGILLYEFKHLDGDVVEEHHHQVHQILYALEGKGQIALNGVSSEFNQDSVAVILPETVHSIRPSAKLTVLVLAFHDAIFPESDRDGLLGQFFSSSHRYPPRSFDGNELRQLLRRALFEQAGDDSLKFLCLRIVLMDMLVVLARSRQAASSAQPAHANHLRAERIRQHIDTHYFEIVNANDISLQYGISSRYMNAIFKERYKVTPTQYLMNFRIDKAKQMLAETDKEIAAICFELGFETVSTFYRTFKQSVKTTPNKYRAFYKNQQPVRSRFSFQSNMIQS